MLSDKLLITVREARTVLSLSNNTIWRLIRERELDVVGSPAKRLITTASIDAYIARQLEAAAAARGQVRPAHAKMHAARAAKKAKASEKSSPAACTSTSDVRA